MLDERTIEQAARWHARLAAPDCSDRDRARFERWRRRNRAHAAAYAAAERLARDLDRHATTDARLQRMAHEAYVAGAAEVPTAAEGRAHLRPWAVPATLAAALVALVVAVALRDQLWPKPEPTPYRTATSERRDVTLEDGSTVHLDVATELSALMTSKRRSVEMRRGRALFDVADEAARPFTVEAGEAQITALGTLFQVQREPGRTTVTLAEGSVSVADRRAAREERLVPGEQLRIDDDSGSWTRHTIDPEAATSWSRGRHIFRTTPLAEALEEVNRYATTPVRLADPAFGDLPVSGTFVAGDSELIVSALVAVLPLQVEERDGAFILVPRPEPAR